MRILMTGGEGQLGRELAQQDGPEIVAVGREQCNITDTNSIATVLDSVRPDAVVNCAAWTRVDAAEAEPEAAFQVNARGARLLASATAERNVALLHMSTDFVFNGEATQPIEESAAPSPLSVYGHSKLAGEAEVRQLHPRPQIVRTSWLYGQEGPNFVLTMLRLAAERDSLRVVADQWGSPTWTGHLAPALLRLVELGVPGTYHLTGSGATTWHGLATSALARAGMGTEVTPITTDEFPAPARRPRYSVLANHAWQSLGEAPLPAWEEGLAAYIGLRLS